jgi:LL-H family phage holin
MSDQILALFWNTLGILIPALCVMAIELIRRKLGMENIRKIQEELNTKMDLASLAIKFVEQAYKDLHGQDKYNQAANWLAARAGEKGIKVTSDEVKGLIEAAVRMAKDEFGEQWANATADPKEESG